MIDWMSKNKCDYFQSSLSDTEKKQASMNLTHLQAQLHQ